LCGSEGGCLKQSKFQIRSAMEMKKKTVGNSQTNETNQCCKSLCKRLRKMFKCLL